SRQQAGFRRRLSTIDHTFVVKQLNERCREYKISLGLLFVDFKETFDSAWHNAVLQALPNQRVNPVYSRIMKNPLTRSQMEVTLSHEPIKIRIGRGVKQGDLFPKAFTGALEDVLWNIMTAGVQTDGEVPQMLLLADDFAPLLRTR
ncbi:hypothetical protein Tcan_01304, partial [Toxocara canis]